MRRLETRNTRKNIRKRVQLPAPDLPSRREVEEHNLSHIPFRSWCNPCLRGRGRSAHWRRRCVGEGVDGRAVTTFCMDYMYLIEEDNAEERDGGARTARGGTTLGRPTIVGVDRKTGGVHAHQVKSTGSGDPWIKRIAADIEELGHGGRGVVLKANQEVAITDVQRQAVAVRSDETVPMNSFVGESQSNDRVENAVQRVQGFIRTLEDALERRLNTRIRSSDTIFLRMVGWSAGLITRYVKG